MTTSSDPLLPVGDGHTPLGEDDIRGLKLSYITTRGELNEAEQANILKCRQRNRLPTLGELLDADYLRALHREMFGDVWAWAGTFRQLETSIGIDPAQISVSVRNLVADARVWTEQEGPLTIAVRFHHRLVWIHPFPNGNGRHGRQAADYLMQALGEPPLTWGSLAGEDDAEGIRRQYLAALRDADQGRFEHLEVFAAS